jgi:hypothetical protein
MLAAITKIASPLHEAPVNVLGDGRSGNWAGTSVRETD